jgi:AraC-like DNA-binding protein
MDNFREKSMPLHAIDFENTSELYIALGYIKCLFDYLIEIKAPITPILNVLGLDERDLEDHDRLLHAGALDVALDIASELTGDPLFGFNAGRYIRPTHLGTMGFLVMCCETSADFLQLFVQYGQLMGNGFQVHYEINEDAISLGVNLHESKPIYSHHVVEFNFTAWLTLFRWLAGSDVWPLSLELDYEATTDYSVMRDYVGCEIRFSQPAIKISLPKHYMQRLLMHGDTSMRQTIEIEVRRRLQVLQTRQQCLDPKLCIIRQLIADNLFEEPLELNKVAQAINEPVRSLQRYLFNQKTTYKQLLDEVRQEMAKQHMLNHELSLVDVALVLGFSEQSTFQRAFKRWFGMSPGQFRKTMGGAQKR